jgi:2-succinyl-5-enolpyruvyl-6-hydroxy-3-cyclohexene-1-carboxylate synthase
MSATAVCRALVDDLLDAGVREAVVAPGSRSGPLAIALVAADRAGALRLHVRVDERTAAFLALGLAKASRSWVPVVTTSGTASANLHPALLEARHAGVRLIAITADRPARLRGTGANQTTDQVGLFPGVAYGDDPAAIRPTGAPESGARRAARRARRVGPRGTSNRGARLPEPSAGRSRADDAPARRGGRW